MSDKEKVDVAELAEKNRPRKLENRVRICGKWRKKGYKPTAVEKKQFERRERLKKDRRERIAAMARAVVAPDATPAK